MLRVSEQDRPDIAGGRRTWRQQQAGFDPARLIFLDESGAMTNLTRLRGRAQWGQHVHASSPHGHWQTTTMIGSIRVDGTTACMAIEGAPDTEVFRAYVQQALCPTLRPGDVVVMDNLSPHKSDRTLSLIEQKGAHVRFLPAYAPDLNPIEQIWSKVKASLLRMKLRRAGRLDASARAGQGAGAPGISLRSLSLCVGVPAGVCPRLGNARFAPASQCFVAAGKRGYEVPTVGWG